MQPTLRTTENLFDKKLAKMHWTTHPAPGLFEQARKQPTASESGLSCAAFQRAVGLVTKPTLTLYDCCVTQ